MKKHELSLSGLLVAVFAILCSAIPSFATVFVKTDTITLLNKTAVIRASSELPATKGDKVTNKQTNLYDNDSTTRWIDGSQLTGEGEWLEIKFPLKYKFKGMILGLGCRKESMCMEDYSIPLKIKLKIDEKPAYDFNAEWDIRDDDKNTLTRQEVNVRKAFLYFDCDTPYTTASFQIKFDAVKKGQRYEKVAMSDIELIEATDKHFVLPDILKSITINPNDLGTINSPALLIGSGDSAYIKHYLDSLGSGYSDSAKVDAALNGGMHDITDASEITRLSLVLKSMFMKENRLVRYRTYGRTVTYMFRIGQVGVSGKAWDVWSYITTIQSAKGLEIAIRYVPFAN